MDIIDQEPQPDCTPAQTGVNMLAGALPLPLVRGTWSSVPQGASQYAGSAVCAPANLCYTLWRHPTASGIVSRKESSAFAISNPIDRYR
jgi:hypothetical protein